MPAYVAIPCCRVPAVDAPDGTGMHGMNGQSQSSAERRFSAVSMFATAYGPVACSPRMPVVPSSLSVVFWSTVAASSA
jgi:hypothetical protein